MSKNRSSIDRWLGDISIRRKLTVVVVVFSTVIVALAGVSYLAMGILTQVRAYVAGEGLYSKAQKDAVYHLVRYAHSQNEAEFEKFRSFLAVPIGDRKARLELEKTETDFAAAERAFIEARNDPADVKGMMQLFKRFRNVDYLDRAIRIWAEGDRLVAELHQLGLQLHAHISQSKGLPLANEVERLLNHIDQRNTELTKLEDDFSYTLGEAARWIKDVLVGLMLVTTAVLLVFGWAIAYLISHNLVSSIRQLRDGAERVGSGDLSSRMELNSSDEVGLLAADFDRMTESLRQALQQRHDLESKLIVSDRMATMGLLAAGIGHEINNPLTYVMANFEFISKKLEQDVANLSDDEIRKLKRWSTQGLQGAGRIRDIVQDLRVFSRVEEERQNAVDVVAVIESTIRIAWNEIHHKARLEKDLRAVPPITGSMSRLGQVILNLMVNAAQAIPEGDANNHEIRVVTRQSDNGDVVIEIADTGSGIPEAIRDRIFDPFFTTKPVGVGTGMGLSIVKTLVISMRGSIEVESPVSGGTVFRATFPPSDLEIESEPQGPTKPY